MYQYVDTAKVGGHVPPPTEFQFVDRIEYNNLLRNARPLVRVVAVVKRSLNVWGCAITIHHGVVPPLARSALPSFLFALTTPRICFGYRSHRNNVAP